jgi:hypothetical protein
MENAFPRGSHLLLSTSAWEPAMNTPPIIQFFSGRSECFVQDGERWRRLTAEDDAHGFTGFNRETNEASVGVYATKRPNGLFRIGFDIFKLNVNLRSSVIERLKNRWQRQEAQNLSASMLRCVGRRTHFSKTFAQFEISIHRLAEWRLELESILSDPGSYESIERRTTDA